MNAAEPLTEFSENCYLAYPHTNGFLRDGRLVLGQLDEDAVHLRVLDPETSQSRVLCTFSRELRGEREDFLWFDVSLDRDVIAVNSGEGIYRVLPDRPMSETFQRVARNAAPPGGGQLPSITADGRSVLFERRLDGHFGLCRANLQTGEVEELLRLPWHANHFHHCPHDPSWIGFAHEGAAPEVSDRVWAWHAKTAPVGRCLFEQTASGLYLGHERWRFDRTGCLVVAYGESPGTPRGLYHCEPNAEPVLVSEGDRDWHVNISMDGRWAVVDTTGPHDAPGRGWAEAGSVSDILLVNMKDGSRQFLARSRKGDCHPRHPHPAFSRDGRWVYFNEADDSGRRSRVCRVRNPERATR